LSTFTQEKFTSTLTKYFNIIEENDEGWIDSRKIWAMLRAICWSNPDIIRSNPWIYNVKDKLEENWSNWDLSQAVDFFNTKARSKVIKPKCSILGINRKKGHGNKSKKGHSESASSDSNSGNISVQSQKLRGYKLNGEPTKEVIKGINISPILHMKSRLADSQMQSLPHVIHDYLEEHYLSKMPPPKSKSASKRSKAYSMLKKNCGKATKRQVKLILSSVISEPDKDEGSSNEEDDPAPTSVSTNTTGRRGPS